MDNTSVPRNQDPVNDGVIWDEEAGEFAVYLDGVNVGFAREYGGAWKVYGQALATRCQHFSREHNRVGLGAGNVA